MMRYQRVSPDCLPFSNGKKSNLRTTTTCKEEGENGKTVPNNNGFDANFDGGKGFRFRSPSRAQENNHHHHSHSHSHSHNHHNNGGSGGSPNSPPLTENNHNNNSSNQQHNNNPSQRLDISPSTGGDVLLQWGQKKRARLSRTEIRSMADDSSSSSSIQGRQPLNKVQRRGSGLMDKFSTVSLPPQPPPPLPLPSNGGSNSRASNLRSKETSGFIHGRNIEERSGVAANGSPSRNSGSSTRAAVSRSTAVKASPSSPDKIDKKIPGSGSRKDEKQQQQQPNGSLTRAAADHASHLDSGPGQSEQETGANNHNTGSMAGAGGEKLNVVEVIEWPKIYVSLSRKEKEDDFLAMKGTKLPHRPKKRAKNVDRTLQYCFPGMWLSDLTKSRYEVREKKSVKKQKRRGLKGMESMESDSE